MSNIKYSNEFKLQVVNEYISGNLGCRLLAKKYNLPSKNYIVNWKKQLIKKGLLPNFKVSSHKGGPKKNLSTKTPYELQLEQQNLELRAELAYLKELQSLVDNDKKNSNF